MGPIGATETEDPQVMIEAVGEKLKDIIYKELELPAEPNRQAQISLAKRNLLYMQGKQYLFPQMASDGRSYDWKPVQVEEKDGKKRTFSSTYNIVSADGVKYVAIVGQRAPNIKAVPLDPWASNQIRMANDAQTASMHLHRIWDIRRRMREIAFYQWSTSAVFLHTKYNADGLKYGEESIPVIEMREVEIRPAGMMCYVCGAVANQLHCQDCGATVRPESYQPAIKVEVPYEAGQQAYPKGEVELEILTAFDVGHTFGAKTLRDCQFVTIDLMKPNWMLKSRYDLPDDFAQAGDSDRGTPMDAELAKETVESPNGVPCYDKSSNLTLESRKYIRPDVYHALTKADRDLMKQNYPTGALITIVGNKVVKIEHKCMDDYLSVCKTGTGPYISDPPLCQGIIPIQDDLNDAVNLGKETLLRMIPKTMVDATLLTPQHIKEAEALVGELVRVKIQGGQSIGSLYGQLPVAKMSDQMMPFIEWQRNMSREIDGMQPAVYGGGTPATTFRGENQRKNQALAQLQPGFDELQSCVCVATKNGVKEQSRYKSGEIFVPSNNPMTPTRRMVVENLQLDGWDLQAEESAPVTVAEKQERISGISQENPDLANVLGFSHPMNTEQMQRIFGVDGFYTPGAAQFKRCLVQIQSLLQEQPIDDFDPMTGMPMRMPSQMPDPYEFKDAMFMSEVFRAWVLSDVGQDMAESNPTGLENVKLFGGQLDLMAAPSMPPAEGEVVDETVTEAPQGEPDIPLGPNDFGPGGMPTEM